MCAPAAVTLSVTDGACLQEPTRLEALRWVQVLLRHSKQAVLAQWHVLMPNLLDSLTAPSDDVVMQVGCRCLCVQGFWPLCQLPVRLRIAAVLRAEC